MYIPSDFAESDLSRLHELIEDYSFGLLISHVEGQAFASHLPFLLDRTIGSHGRLIGHMARANPQWEKLDGQQVLAVFSGPHAYISPTWYEAENVVPTWNYAAVHVYGRIQISHDPDALLQIVQATVGVYEQAMPQPWSIDGSTTFVKRLLDQIVGFHIDIERIEGKWKLNQNHPAERRKKVVQALRRQQRENPQAIADMMETTGHLEK